MASVLGVRAQEVDRVRRLVGASFLLGLALVLFYGAGNAVFLTRFDVTALPWVYIVNAVVVIVVGLTYGAWSAARARRPRACSGSPRAMTVSVPACGCGRRCPRATPWPSSLAVWFRLLFIFAVLGLWEIASVVFDIRQAKRLFAAVALGMMLAFVVGGDRHAAAHGDARHRQPRRDRGGLLHALHASTSVACCVATRSARDHDAETAAPATRRDHDRPLQPAHGVDEVRHHPPAVRAGVRLLRAGVGHVRAPRTRWPASSACSWAAMTVVMVLVTGLASGPLHRPRSGSGRRRSRCPSGCSSSPCRPVSTARSSVSTPLFFALVCALLATDHVLGNAIGEPAGAVLFQPMPPAASDAGPPRRRRVAGLGGARVLAGSCSSRSTPSTSIRSRRTCSSSRRSPSWASRWRCCSTATTSTPCARRHDARVRRRSAHTRRRARRPRRSALATSWARGPSDQLLAGLVGHGAPGVVELALGAIARSGDRAAAGDVEQVVDRDDLPRPLGSAPSRRSPRSTRSGASPGRGPSSPASTPISRSRRPRRPRPARRGRASPAGTARRRRRDRDRRPTLDAAQSVAPAPTITGARRRVPHRPPAPAAGDRCPRRRRPGGAAARRGDPPAARRRGRRRRRGARARTGQATTTPSSRRAWSRPRRRSSGVPGTRRSADVDAPAPSGTISPRISRSSRWSRHAPRPRRHGAGRGRPPSARSSSSPADRSTPRSPSSTARAAARRRDARAHRRRRRPGQRHRSPRRDARRPITAGRRRRARAGRRRGAWARRCADAPDDGAAGRAAAGARRRPPADRRGLVGSPPTTSHHPTRPDGGTTMDPTIEQVLALRPRRHLLDALLRQPRRARRPRPHPHRSRRAPSSSPLARSGTSCYAITSGAVEVQDANGQVTRLDAGTVFGELAVLDPRPRNATVTAVTEVELLVVPRHACSPWPIAVRPSWPRSPACLPGGYACRADAVARPSTEPTRTSVSRPCDELRTSSGSNAIGAAPEHHHHRAAAIAEPAHLVALRHSTGLVREVDAAHLDGADHDDRHLPERLAVHDHDRTRGCGRARRPVRRRTPAATEWYSPARSSTSSDRHSPSTGQWNRW